jgi:uncharacterized membrane protein
MARDPHTSVRPPRRWIGIGLAITAVIVLVMLILLWRLMTPGG